MIVLRAKATDMITRTLKILKKWNPKVFPKYGFVHLDEHEMTSLDIVLGQVKVFVCNFHKAEAWQNWISKSYCLFNNARRLPDCYEEFDVMGIFWSRKTKKLVLKDLVATY